jgi:hypothetical protein
MRKILDNGWTAEIHAASKAAFEAGLERFECQGFWYRICPCRDTPSGFFVAPDFIESEIPIDKPGPAELDVP